MDVAAAVVLTGVLVVFLVSLVFAVIYVMSFMTVTEKRLDQIAENTQKLLDREP